MNIHHLELFYYVARHGGIMPAVRNIPYGIQQPAVSAQVAQLEEHLGVTLFHRRPFSITPAGEKLYTFIEPFFSNLEKIAADFQGGQAKHFRIGASTIVLRDHVPRLLQGVHRNFPGLKVSLREGFPVQLEEMLSKGEVDMIITLIDRKPPSGFQSEILMELPLCLLVEKNSPLKSAEELWKHDKITESLISLPSQESLTRQFLARVTEIGSEWYPSVEASSVDLIETYVASGLGIGLGVMIPKRPLPPNIRALPLKEFPRVLIGALWRDNKSPLPEAFLEVARKRAKEMM